MALYTVGPLLMLLVFWVTAQFIFGTKSRERFDVPDDVRAAREMLAQKFTGLTYFRIHESQREFSPFISVVEAKSQVEGIAGARELPAEAAAKINKLIDKLAEPPEARMMASDRVNALKLNLALDELR